MNVYNELTTNRKKFAWEKCHRKLVYSLHHYTDLRKDGVIQRSRILVLTSSNNLMRRKCAFD